MAPTPTVADRDERALDEPANPVLVQLDGVWRTMEGTEPIHAVANVTLRIERGEWWSITGASGSGKSTLLNLIGCLDRPTQGEYRFDGTDVASLSDAQRAGLRARHLGFVFQAFHLLSTRTATENVMVADLYRRGPRSDRRERARGAREGWAGFAPRRLGHPVVRRRAPAGGHRPGIAGASRPVAVR